MGSTKIFHFRPNQNLSSIRISSLSTFAADNPFFSHIFQQCSKEKALRPGRQANARMIVSGFKPTVVDANCLLQMYIKCCLFKYASQVFDIMPERDCNSMISGYSVNGKMGMAQSLFIMMSKTDVISWNSLISGYLQYGNCFKSFEVFVMMGKERETDGVAYNETTFAIVLKAIANMEDYVLGAQVHGAVMKFGFETDLVTANVTLNTYAKCNMLDESLRFFHTMPVRDSVSWSTIIAGSIQSDKLKDGLELFKRMLKEGVGVTGFVYASVFKSCAGLSDPRLGLQLHAHAVKSNVGAEPIVGSAILNMYAKCNDLLNATKVFKLLPSPNLQSYTTLIVGYARCDRVSAATED